MQTTVRMLSHSSNPIETIYACWEASRHNKHVEDPATLATQRTSDAALNETIMKTFEQVIDSAIPVSENISFTFLLEGVSVALREQMVRHRVGHHFGDRIGVDIVPDLADSTWWAQSMRILPMDRFATDEAYDVPASLLPVCKCKPREGWGIKTDRGDWIVVTSGKGSEYRLTPEAKEATCWHDRESCNEYRVSVVVPSQQPPYLLFRASHTEQLAPAAMLGRAIEHCECVGPLVKDHGIMVPAAIFYKQQMAWIQSAYTKLIKAGVPMEDARNLIPLGATSRITWTINLAALQHVVGKRGCWILQLGVWEPVIRGMIEELATKVHPIFRKLIAPPCVKGGKYVGCKFVLDNDRRIQGEDEIPPCRLFISQEWDKARHLAHDAMLNANITKPYSGWVGLTVNGNAQRQLVPSLDRPDRAVAQARSDSMKDAYGRLWGFDPDKGPDGPPPEGATLWNQANAAKSDSKGSRLDVIA